jgi:GT2 family glycosyltransferase
LKLSVIIPTHNRAETLRNCLNSISACSSEGDFEVVVVDNNSTDHTKEVAHSFPFARYVFEGRTAFTRARHAGAEAATGQILMYLDDDVLMWPGSIREVIRLFVERPDCGVVAGRIEPKYEEAPPQWALDCQKTFNGWSLYNPGQYEYLGEGVREVDSACGPMMAIRKETYDTVGGFPPDTVGVETNKGARSFSKLYVGPGDYGLCIKVRRKGLKIYYSSKAAVYHVIPAVRFTRDFWRSRMIGEGCHEAVMDICFWNLSRAKMLVKRARRLLKVYRSLRKLPSTLPEARGILPDSLWIFYFASYLAFDHLLRSNVGLAEFLWRIGDQGVSDQDYDEVIRRLPPNFKTLVSREFMYDPTPMDNTANAIEWIRQLQSIAFGSSRLYITTARVLLG